MELQFKSLRHYSPSRGDQVFRWSLGRTILPTVLFTLLFIGAAVQMFHPHPKVSDIPYFVRGMVTVGMLGFAWVAWAQTQAALGPRGLLAVLAPQTLWVKFRSPLNAHVGDDTDLQIVGIPLSAIEWAQPRTVKTLTRGANNRTSARSEEAIDLGLKPELDLEPLEEQLTAERERKKKANHSHQHLPVRVLQDSVVRLNLYNVGSDVQALQRALPSAVEQRRAEVEVIDRR